MEADSDLAAREQPGTHVALVGPTLPFRGGIAQYTTQLHRALANKIDTLTVSFSKQYPSFLYPGSSDIEPGFEGYKEQGVTYTLNAYSPISWHKATNEILASNCRAVIFNWWTLYWQPVFAMMSRRLQKNGIQTYFLCHNLFDHDASPIKKRISSWLLKQANGYIVHSSEQARQLEDTTKGAPILFRLHPIYDQYPVIDSPSEPRGDLDLLFFGLIRPYKGLDILIEALSKLDNQNIYLSIVGESWESNEDLATQIDALGIKNVDLHLSYVSDEEAATYFTRADIVVLPYLSATGSGVVAMAYNYGKPVIASRVGGLQDCVLEGETGWLVEPGSATALANCIHDIKREAAQNKRAAIEKFCQANDWKTMASEIVEFIADQRK